MPLTISILGTPSLARDGRPVPGPRGAKAWGLLAYLLLSERPADRRRLSALLFPAADDPLGALRWSLAELRRSLGVPEAFRGDPPRPRLPEGTIVDALAPGRDGRPAADPDPELLGDLSFATSPGFEVWLLVERRRRASAEEARIHETALSDLAAGRVDDALAAASRVVAMNPLDEGHHELLVRCLALGGDRAAAIAHADRCEALFREELGVPPSPAVRRAAFAGAPESARGSRASAATARGQLEAGEAAAAAGAAESAVEWLRRACTEAARSGDGALRARALVALGTTLVHAVRGRDEEGAAVLHQAIAVAGRAGDRASEVAARRELGYVSVQAGRRESAGRWLASAEALAQGDAEIAAVRAVQGMNHSDMAEYGAAIARFSEAVERADACGDGRLAAWSLSLLGRLHLLRGDDAPASEAIDRCLALVDDEHWLAFCPLPETLRAELDVRAGDVGAASDRLEHAFGLACQFEDPCWEALSARGIGLLEARRGDPDGARRWLEDALARCARYPDRYEWAYGHVLDALAGEAVRAGDPAARGWAHRLEGAGRRNRHARAGRARAAAPRPPGRAGRARVSAPTRPRHRQPGARPPARRGRPGLRAPRLTRRLTRISASLSPQGHPE